MLKEERYDKILEILENENYVSASTLSKRLYVSLPTIRRDLGELSRRGLISRSHGGATKSVAGCTVTPISFRKSVNIAAKRKLAKKAVELIDENDIIFMDASTTALQMADYIPTGKNITVVTNSIPLGTLLIKKGIKTYCTGGEMQENSLCYAGSYAERFVRNFNFDLMFFSCHCINSKGIIADTSEAETNLRKLVLAQSEKTIFLCDGSKLDLNAPYNLCKADSVSYIITDMDEINKYITEKENCRIIAV